jgi:hypothetical protein
LKPVVKIHEGKRVNADLKTDWTIAVMKQDVKVNDQNEELSVMKLVKIHEESHVKKNVGKFVMRLDENLIDWTTDVNDLKPD